MTPFDKIRAPLLSRQAPETREQWKAAAHDLRVAAMACEEQAETLRLGLVKGEVA